MSLIGKKSKNLMFRHTMTGDIINVTDKDLEGKWSVFFFIQEILHLSVRSS